MSLRQWLFGAALAVLGMSFSAAAASADVASAAAPDAAAIRQALKDHPEIVLDVLRDNSETLLDIVQQGADQRRRQALLRQWQDDSRNVKQVALDGRPSRGPADAPVTLVAFSDFTCAYCQQAAFTVETLLKRYPGKIRYVYKESVGTELGRLGARWFLAASRQDPAKAWRLYALLFDAQQRFMADPQTVLTELAATAGLDAKAIEADLKANAKSYDEIIDADVADAKRLGFSGTPYFLVDNMVIRGALPLENFIDAVELALKQ